MPLDFKDEAYTQNEPTFPSDLEESRVLFSGENQNLGDRITNLISAKDSPGENKADCSVEPQRA